MHEACDALPAFARLASECRGDELAAATAVETLLNELGELLEHSDPTGPPRLRLGLTRACSQASEAVSGQREVLEGLSGVAPPGYSPGDKLAPREGDAARALAVRLREDPRLKEVGRLAGRFKQILSGKRRQRVQRGCDELVSVERGSELERLLPTEFARLTRPLHRLAFLRDLLERQCLQYEFAGSGSLGKGPVIVCLDKSDSMSGEKDTFAVAAALALHGLAEEERRPFALVSFDSAVRQVVRATFGEKLSINALLAPCSGGTDIAAAIEDGLEVITDSQTLARADIVLITDGESSVERAAELRQRAKELGVNILGLGIGIPSDALTSWCDDVSLVHSVETLEDEVVDAFCEV